MYFALLSFPSRKDWLYFVSVAMWSFNLVISLTTCINLASLYISPHSALNNTLVQVKARDLLMCARSSVPNLFNEWTLLDKCLESAHVYNITAGRIPYDRSSLRHTPIAFVFMAAKDRSIFVTPEYQGLSLYLKALVLIHECAHIGLGAVELHDCPARRVGVPGQRQIMADHRMLSGNTDERQHRRCKVDLAGDGFNHCWFDSTAQHQPRNVKALDRNDFAPIDTRVVVSNHKKNRKRNPKHVLT